LEKRLAEMNLVQRVQSLDVDETNLQKTQYEILDNPEYQEVFKGLGCLPGQYSIKLDSSVSPTIHPPRKIPIALHDKVRQELTLMEKTGVIVKQKEPTEWVNSMVVVNKGTKIRICIDPKDLNRYQDTLGPYLLYVSYRLC
jgi:hypothetical protein